MLWNLPGGILWSVQTPFDFAFIKKEHAIARVLAERMTHFSAPYQFGSSTGTLFALREAVNEDDVEIADILLQRGARVAEAEPLFDRVRSPAMADFLLAKGANVNARTPDGRTALHALASAGDYGFDGDAVAANFLLTHGADVNARDAQGQTPLHAAVRSGAIKAVTFLVEHGADASLKDNNGNTPLALANSGEVAKTVGQAIRTGMVEVLMQHSPAGTTAPAGLWCVAMSCPGCARLGLPTTGQQCFSTKVSCESTLASVKAANPGSAYTYSACTNEPYLSYLQATCTGQDAVHVNGPAAGSAYDVCVQDKLAAAVAQFQGNPADDGQRGEIIVLAGETVAPPAVPREARTHLNRGVAAFGIAKSPADYQEAIEEFRQASNLAPWWADSYFNLGKAQEKAGDYPAAIKSYGLYLLAAPHAGDAQETLDTIDKLGYLADRDEKAQQALAELQSWARNKVGEWQSAYGATVFKMSTDITNSAAPNSKSGDWRWLLNRESNREDRRGENMHLRFSVEGDQQDLVGIMVPWNDVYDTGKFCLSRQDWDAGEQSAPREYHIVSCDAKAENNKEGWIQFGRSTEGNLPWVQVLYACENNRCAGSRYILVR